MHSNTMKRGSTPSVAYPEYHDYATADSTTIARLAIENEARSSSNKESKRTSGPIEIFPMILHQLLEEAEAKGHLAIVGWQTHGRAFRIHDKTRFELKVLPLYFEHQSMYTSFQRQLNSYGFHRLYKNGLDQKCYYHEMCLRSRPDLAALICRCIKAASPVRRRFDPTTEPNFSVMAPLPPTISQLSVTNQRPLAVLEPSNADTDVETSFDSPSETAFVLNAYDNGRPLRPFEEGRQVELDAASLSSRQLAQHCSSFDATTSNNSSLRQMSQSNGASMSASRTLDRSGPLNLNEPTTSSSDGRSLAGLKTTGLMESDFRLHAAASKTADGATQGRNHMPLTHLPFDSALLGGRRQPGFDQSANSVRGQGHSTSSAVALTNSIPIQECEPETPQSQQRDASNDGYYYDSHHDGSSTRTHQLGRGAATARSMPQDSSRHPPPMASAMDRPSSRPRSLYESTFESGTGLGDGESSDESSNPNGNGIVTCHGHIDDDVYLQTTLQSATQTDEGSGSRETGSSILSSRVGHYMSAVQAKFDHMVDGALGDANEPDTLSHYSCSSTSGNTGT